MLTVSHDMYFQSQHIHYCVPTYTSMFAWVCVACACICFSLSVCACVSLHSSIRVWVKKSHSHTKRFWKAFNWFENMSSTSMAFVLCNNLDVKGNGEREREIRNFQSTRSSWCQKNSDGILLIGLSINFQSGRRVCVCVCEIVWVCYRYAMWFLFLFLFSMLLILFCDVIHSEEKWLIVNWSEAIDKTVLASQIRLVLTQGFWDFLHLSI